MVLIIATGMGVIKKSVLYFLLRYLIVTGIFFFYSCNGNADNNFKKPKSDLAKPYAKESGIYIDLERILNKMNDSNALIVQVEYDHYFNKPKKYKGFYINTIIDSVLKSAGFDTTNAIVGFECTDGYEPFMALSKVLGSIKGYIVFKDLDTSVKKNWADSVSDKFRPYYLVWDSVKKEDDSFVWPYSLTGLRLTSREMNFQQIHPSGDLSVTKGFELFRDNCSMCHAVNKTGGSLGPEFNVPKNITEYWSDQDILSFAKNPQSYRYNSSMPAIANLEDSEFMLLIEYLKFMRSKKLKD